MLHGAAAKAAMRQHGVQVLPKWPPYSPELNPQENVWSWAEGKLRKLEDNARDDSFEAFQRFALDACKASTIFWDLVCSVMVYAFGTFQVHQFAHRHTQGPKHRVVETSRVLFFAFFLIKKGPFGKACIRRH